MGPNLGLRNLEGRHLKWNSTALPGNRFWIAGKLRTLKISHFIFLVFYVPTNRFVRQLSCELIRRRYVDVHDLKQVQIYWDSFSFQKLEIITNGTGILQIPTMAQKIINNDPQKALKLFKCWTVVQRMNYNGARILEKRPMAEAYASGRSMEWETKNVSRWIFFEIGQWWCVDSESRSSKSGG